MTLAFFLVGGVAVQYSIDLYLGLIVMFGIGAFLWQVNASTARTSAGGVIIGPQGKLVLVNQGSNVWSFPKGGVEAGESPLEAARREIKEECGIKEVELLRELGSYTRYRIGQSGVGEVTTEPETKRILFLFRTRQSKLRADGSETVSARWVRLDEALLLLAHPKDRAFLESVRSFVESAIQSTHDAA